MCGPPDTGKTVLLDWFETECNKVGPLAAPATPSVGLGSVEDLLRMTTTWLGSGEVNLSTPPRGALPELAIDQIRQFPAPALRVLVQRQFHTG